MDIFNQFLESTKQAILDANKEAIEKLRNEVLEEWVNKKELAKHLDVSERWISEYLSEIPHVKPEGGGVKFKKSHVDKWRIERFGKNYDEVHTKAPVVKIAKRSKVAWEPIK